MGERDRRRAGGVVRLGIGEPAQFRDRERGDGQGTGSLGE
jgi:hypothetical protein